MQDRLETLQNVPSSNSDAKMRLCVLKYTCPKTRENYSKFTVANRSENMRDFLERLIYTSFSPSVRKCDLGFKANLSVDSIKLLEIHCHKSL